MELSAEADLSPAGKKPPKGVLNWVAQPAPGQEPLKFEVRGRLGGVNYGEFSAPWLLLSGRKACKGVLNWVAQPAPGQEPLRF